MNSIIIGTTMLSVWMLTFAVILERVLMRQKQADPMRMAILFQFTLGIVSLVMALAFGKFSLAFDTRMYPRLILASFLWAGATLYNLKAIRHLGAAEVTIIGTSGTIEAIILGIVLLGEKLTLQTIVGIGLILTAVMIVTMQKLDFGSRKSVGFALLSSICAALGVTNDSVILKSFDAFSYTAIMSFLPGIILLIWNGKNNIKIIQEFRLKTVALILIISVFYAIQAITYYLAMQQGAPISWLSPMMKIAIVLTVVLAAVFLGERKHLTKKLIASGLVLVGAWMMR